MTTKKKLFPDAVIYGTLAAYLVILAALLFCKASAFRSVNLVPFRFVTDYITGSGILALSNVIGNILLFIPMGVYLGLLNPRHSLPVNLGWVLLSSAAAEALQFICKVGASDIDDLILNGLGGLLGLLCWNALLHLLGEKARRVAALAALLLGAGFIGLFLCLHFGVFGFRIRIF